MPVGSTLFVEVAGPVPAGAGHGAWLKRMNHLMFTIVHGEETMTMRLTLDAGDEEAAGHLQSMGEGFLAMMKLRHGRGGDDEEENSALNLLKDLRMKVDGSVMRINWPIPRTDAMRVIEDHMKKHRHNHRDTKQAE